MKKLPNSLFRLLGGLIALFLLHGCGSYRLATLNHDPVYPTAFVIPVSNDTKIDTISSFTDLKWKLHTDFNFRWDFAQYAMNQPYSWYWNNPRLDGIWRPYNRFDVYLHSHWFWTDWAWNYNYGFNNWFNWHRPYYYYGWNRPYRPWHYNNYNVIWGSSRNNYNVAYINGRRGSISTNYNRSNSIKNNIITRYNTPRNNNNNNVNKIVKDLINNGYNVRVYNNTRDFNNDQIINNNSRTNWNSQSSNNGRGSWSRQIVPSGTTGPTIINSVQPRQVRGGSGSPVLQQSRSSQSSSGSGRSSRGGIQN